MFLVFPGWCSLFLMGAGLVIGLGSWIAAAKPATLGELGNPGALISLSGIILALFLAWFGRAPVENRPALYESDFEEPEEVQLTGIIRSLKQDKSGDGT